MTEWFLYFPTELVFLTNVMGLDLFLGYMYYACGTVIANLQTVLMIPVQKDILFKILNSAIVYPV